MNEVFLTFDDGPIPDLTPWVLDFLKERNVKASFFLVGENALRNPELVERMVNEGHSIGNHTHNHLNGFKSKLTDYIVNIEKCQKVLEPFIQKTDKPLLFRPPYGRISPREVIKVRKMGFRIIMWDILSKDYDKGISPETCIKNVVNNLSSGSVIVMHDNVKAEYNLKKSLPGIVDGIIKKGFTFGTL